MLWIALGLLAFTAFLVYIINQQGRWSMVDGARPPTPIQSSLAQPILTYGQHLEQLKLAAFWPHGSAHDPIYQMAWGSLHAVLYDSSGFFVFSNGIVFTLFATFLLPLWTLSFATEGLGPNGKPRICCGF